MILSYTELLKNLAHSIHWIHYNWYFQPNSWQPGHRSDPPMNKTTQGRLLTNQQDFQTSNDANKRSLHPNYSTTSKPAAKT